MNEEHWTGGRCEATGKVKFLTKAAAKKARSGMKAKGLDVSNLAQYLCLHCGQYHLGNKRVGGRVVPREKHRLHHQG